MHHAASCKQTVMTPRLFCCLFALQLCAFVAMADPQQHVARKIIYTQTG
jgi:hypothetical protein